MSFNVTKLCNAVTISVPLLLLSGRFANCRTNRGKFSFGRKKESCPFSSFAHSPLILLTTSRTSKSIKDLGVHDVICSTCCFVVGIFRYLRIILLPATNTYTQLLTFRERNLRHKMTFFRASIASICNRGRWHTTLLRRRLPHAMGTLFSFLCEKVTRQQTTPDAHTCTHLTHTHAHPCTYMHIHVRTCCCSTHIGNAVKSTRIYYPIHLIPISPVV
jgi:hypothetical protein